MINGCKNIYAVINGCKDVYSYEGCSINKETVFRIVILPDTWRTA